MCSLAMDLFSKLFLLILLCLIQILEAGALKPQLYIKYVLPVSCNAESCQASCEPIEKTDNGFSACEVWCEFDNAHNTSCTAICNCPPKPVIVESEYKSTPFAEYSAVPDAFAASQSPNYPQISLGYGTVQASPMPYRFFSLPPLTLFDPRIYQHNWKMDISYEDQFGQDYFYPEEQLSLAYPRYHLNSPAPMWPFQRMWPILPQVALPPRRSWPDSGNGATKPIHSVASQMDSVNCSTDLCTTFCHKNGYKSGSCSASSSASSSVAKCTCHRMRNQRMLRNVHSYKRTVLEEFLPISCENCSSSCLFNGTEKARAGYCKRSCNFFPGKGCEARCHCPIEADWVKFPPVAKEIISCDMDHCTHFCETVERKTEGCVMYRITTREISSQCRCYA